MPSLVLLLVVLGAPYKGTVDDAKRASEVAAQSFLQLVDEGRFSETWDSAATLMKQQITRERWRLLLEAARSGTGKKEWRSHEGSHFTEILPNTPEGAYVVVDYRSGFLKKPQVRERVTIVFEEGAWRVCGYWMNDDAEKASLPKP